MLAPWAGRRAVARFDYENVYTIPVTAWTVALVLGAAAVGLGLQFGRKPGAKAISGAAAGMGATSIIGIAVYVIGTWEVMPRLG
ncbi:hypothetical protein [Georgenia sp. H159]|uniref:hypothetical protein n=1 Tax=Georgenia sp. H159 TaxID=3076115 RepID=UPI002D779060|nr:hypothetical protein [Georgenia sp. H159]